LDILLEFEPLHNINFNISHCQLILGMRFHKNKNKIGYSVSEIINSLKKEGFLLDKNEISYHNDKLGCWTTCGLDPVPENIFINIEDLENQQKVFVFYQKKKYIVYLYISSKDFNSLSVSK